MGFDLDRLERLAGGLAVLFYVLLFLAFFTAIMGSGGGGLLLLVLGAAAHVGRVGLEDFVERRREFGAAAGPEEGDAGERAIGLRLSWLPEIHLPRRIDLGGMRARAAELGAGGAEGAGSALGQAGATLGALRGDVRSSFAALVAEIRERPARAPRRSADPPHGGAEDAPIAGLEDGYFDDDLVFTDADDDFAVSEGRNDDFAVTDDRYEDFEVADDEYEDFELAAVAEDSGYADLALEADPAYEAAHALEPASEPSPPPRRDAPTAQERYEARQRVRVERGEAAPIVAAVEEAETRRPQRVARRRPGGRPDPLRTRRPTRSF